jgi:hypothetical protein
MAQTMSQEQGTRTHTHTRTHTRTTDSLVPLCALWSGQISENDQGPFSNQE